MSGTDKTKAAPDLSGPVVILVEPQLGENIGMAARAMGNFALSRLRIVKPRDGWPNIAAQRAAAGADHILESAELFDTVEAAGGDCSFLFPTPAAARCRSIPVLPRSILRKPCFWSAMNGSSCPLPIRCRLRCPNAPSPRRN